MTDKGDVAFRKAVAADVPAMAKCRRQDPGAEQPDPRMAAYFEGQHHPQHALAPRIGFVALVGDEVVGYVAGHQTERHACQGELQYLFVPLAHRRRGIATSLLRLLADWFQEQSVRKVCVGIAEDSPPEAKPFAESVGATRLKEHWHVWDDIDVVPRNRVQPRTI